jgi:probable F420-dependent oxidoreductase
MNRPFRFAGGLFRAESNPEWAEGARRLESSGYDTLVIADHFSPVYFAPIPALTAAALATTRLRVLCTVFANDFRHPATLAKEVATADVLSGGRFEFGFGAGYQKPEYDRVGIRFDPPALRVSRFEEALHVLKGLWAAGPFTFRGKHYAITEYDSQPKPMQRPHPPIFIGGGGKRLLSFAAREADIVGILARSMPAGDGLDRTDETTTSLAQKVEWVREAAPHRFEHLELALLIWAVVITDHRQAEAERIAARTQRPVEQILDSPYYLVGTVDAIVEKLLEQRERHRISHISIFQSDTTAFAPVVARLAGK